MESNCKSVITFKNVGSIFIDSFNKEIYLTREHANSFNKALNLKKKKKEKKKL